MMKVDGYNPDHANWLFAKYDPRGGVEAFGRAGLAEQARLEVEAGRKAEPGIDGGRIEAATELPAGPHERPADQERIGAQQRQRCVGIQCFGE